MVGKKSTKKPTFSAERKSMKRRMNRVRACKKPGQSSREQLVEKSTHTLMNEKFDISANNTVSHTKTNSNTGKGLDESGETKECGPDPEVFPQLVVDTQQQTSDNFQLNGRRIVNISHLMKQLETIGNHSLHCTMGHYKLMSENCSGLSCSWTYYCDNCNRNFIVTSEPPDVMNDVNSAVVWGAVSIGNGYSQTEEFMSVLDIPMMTANKFRKEEENIGEVWEKYLHEQMKAAAEEEKEIAIRKQNFMDGVPYITVIGDCGWSKRSYGHSYSSSSGVAVIVGAETKKLLYLGVKNKFCSVCADAKYTGKSAREHKCYRNFSGPSTGMEKHMIVEGFSESVEKYGLVYRYYIGDGDSSVHSSLIEAGFRYVVKIECANHMVRCLSDKLHKLAKDTKIPLESRRLLTEQQVTLVEGDRRACFTRIERLVKGIRVAIKDAGKTGNVEQLRQDVRNAPYHVFGRHSNCRDFCKRTGEVDLTPDLIKTAMFCEVVKYVDCIAEKADRLRFNDTTNQAERYMGLVSKFSGGKRINFSKRGSYRRRCFGAAQSHMKGPSWHISPWKKMTGRSPGKVFKSHFKRRESSRLKRALECANTEIVNKKRRKLDTSFPDANYGLQCAALDMDDFEIQKKCKELISKLQEEVNTPQKRSDLERNTVDQHENELWRASRINRLTASNFGKVVKRKNTTHCHNLVKELVYTKELHTPGILYGRINEGNAIKMYEEERSVKVKKCGLFVSGTEPYLAASPDGLVGDDTLVEIKCIKKVGETSLKIAAGKKGNICLEVNQNGTLQLNRNHHYYFQVQGQLNITNRKYCDFVVYSSADFFVERLERDTKLWEEKMCPLLRRFYYECMLPEIVDGRIPRGLRVREPSFILEARKKTKVSVN